MYRLLFSLLRSPLKSLRFTYYFFVQALILFLHRILLPGYPRYQTLRIALQRIYLISCTLCYPDLPHRLPVSYSQKKARSVAGKGWKGYIIPGNDDSETEKSPYDGKSIVVLFAHGGGYARGEARMYVPYMLRWVKVASEQGLEIVFCTVEYREFSHTLLFLVSLYHHPDCASIEHNGATSCAARIILCCLSVLVGSRRPFK